MEADAYIDLPDTICGDQFRADPVVRAAEDACLVGIIGSAGLMEGCARVVFDPARTPAALTHKDILVVPFSDVGWAPLFAQIGGVVAETGGQLSHAAIIAREFGLPAVVGVKNATRLIQDGQTVVVDGDRGRVYLKQA